MTSTTDASPKAALPYHEPAIATILIQASFLILLNALNFLFDNLIYCGLLAQVFIGVAWGTPGAKWLDADAEATITQIGYLGLILLVYEGGLSTSSPSLKANLPLSLAVALTGIAVPIALSFTLGTLTSASPLQCFAAGAALCATSLGTTFSILGTSGLTATRLGTVLTSAAMLDDVVGLVLVRVISDLGGGGEGGGGEFDAITVVKPVVVSIGLVVVLVVGCRFVVGPGTRVVWRNWGVVERMLPLKGVVGREYVALGVHTLVLVGFVAGATYAGTSGLFAVYLAGAAIRWWDDTFLEVSDGDSGSDTPERKDDSTNEAVGGESSENAAKDNISGPEDTHRAPETAEKKPIEPANPGPKTTEDTAPLPTGSYTYEKYYSPAVNRILKPFFFASIGFSIPITNLFHPEIIWRGIIYTILMLLGKLVTGLWLVRFDIRLPSSLSFSPSKCSPLSLLKSKQDEKNKNRKTTKQHQQQPSQEDQPNQISTKSLLKPLSLYPASILGSAMVARGEIGFLISSLAESKGIFTPSPSSSPSSSSSSSPDSGPSDSSPIFLVVTWAIMLCTIIGPIVVGSLVKRVKRLEGRNREGGGQDPLGVWGVS